MPSERLFWWGLLVYRPPLAGRCSLSCFVWQGWLDLNQRATASKAAALPLGDIPMSVRVGSTSGRRSRTIDLAESNRAHLRAAGPASLEPPTGIEPAHPAWEAGVLPLNYGGRYLRLGRSRHGTASFCLSSDCLWRTHFFAVKREMQSSSTPCHRRFQGIKTTLHRGTGGPGGTRTHVTLTFRQSLTI